MAPDAPFSVASKTFARLFNIKNAKLVFGDYKTDITTADEKVCDAKFNLFLNIPKRNIKNPF